MELLAANRSAPSVAAANGSRTRRCRCRRRARVGKAAKEVEYAAGAVESMASAGLAKARVRMGACVYNGPHGRSGRARS